jgi:hypothetical protein
MNAWRLFICAIVIAAGALVACTGSGGSSSSSPKVITCNLPAGTTVTMVYPIPNATGVPDTISEIVLASTPALPSSWQTLMTTDNINFVTNQTVLTAATPFPTPNATPANFTGTYQSTAVSATLPKASTIIVYLNDTAQSCNSYNAVGSFTSQ